MTARIDPNVLKETVHGERGMILEMIIDASKQIQEEDGIDAYEWVSDSSSDDPFSFIWCCQVLGVDPDGCRERILAKKRTRYAPRKKSASPNRNDSQIIHVKNHACAICHWVISDLNQLVCMPNDGNPRCVERNLSGEVPGHYGRVMPCVYCASKTGSRYRSIDAKNYSEKAWICGRCFVNSRRDTVAEAKKAREIIDLFDRSGSSHLNWLKFVQLFDGNQGLADRAIRFGLDFGYIKRVRRGLYQLTGKAPE